MAFLTDAANKIKSATQSVGKSFMSSPLSGNPLGLVNGITSSYQNLKNALTPAQTAASADKSVASGPRSTNMITPRVETVANYMPFKQATNIYGEAASSPPKATASSPANPYGSAASSPYYKPSVAATTGAAAKPTTTTPAPTTAPSNYTPPASMQNLATPGNGFATTDPGLRDALAKMSLAAEGNTTPPTTNPNPSADNTTPPPAPNGTDTSNLANLRAAYLRTFDQSPEEQANQARLNKLAQDAADVRASFALGAAKINDQPIAMNLLTGQNQALEEQANARLAGIQAESAPVEALLASSLAARERAQNKAQAEMGFSTDDPNKPIEVGGSLVKYNPVSGKYETVYQGAGESSKPIVLSEGAKLVDPVTGKEIATGNAKSTTDPTSYREFQLAQASGYQGNYSDFVMMKSGQSSRPITTGQADLIAEGNNLSNVINPIYNLISSQGNLFGPAAGRIGGINPLDTNAQAAQAQLNNAAQLVGKFLEGGKLAEGDIGRYRTMLPQLTDTPEVAKKKLDLVNTLIQNRQREYISSYGSAGFDVSNYNSPAPSPASGGSGGGGTWDW